MKHEDIAQYLLKDLKRKGADDVIVQLSSSTNDIVKFSNNKISTTKDWSTTMMSVFVAKDKKIMATSLKTFTEKAAADLATRTLQGLKQLQPNNEYFGIAQGPFKYKKLREYYDPKVKDMDIEMIDLVKQSLDITKKKVKRAAGILEKNDVENYLLTSNDIEVRENGSWLYFSIRALVNQNASGHQTAVSRIKNKLNVIETAARAAEIAHLANRPRKRISGTFDVIFEPLAFANIIERIGEGASIFSVESGLSPLKEKLGMQIASPLVTIHDDGTVPNGYASTSFDAEGSPTQKNTIVKNGILKTYLHNTSTAYRYKTKSTGNAGLIAPDPHNIVMEPGTQTKDAIFSSVKNGLYITNVWYTRFQNYSTGDFSTIPRDGAFVIKNGEIKDALKDIRISENLLKVMQNVVMVGKEMRQIKSWEVETPCILPYVLVKNVQITKPE